MSQIQANISKEETSLKNYETLLNTSMGMHGKCFPHEGHTPHEIASRDHPATPGVLLSLNLDGE
jgi:hypothetical protein